MKNRLRQRLRQLRESLSPETVAAASAAICDHLACWSAFQQAQTILTYLAFNNEIDLSALFTRFPDKRWAVPRIEESHLTLHPYDPARLVRHRFGLLEPDPSLPLIEPAALDLAFVPGVGFDRCGGRLGFGGGYYDRFLPTTPGLRVGVTYDELIVPELPMGPNDQRMEWLVSPKGLYEVVLCPMHSPSSVEARSSPPRR